MDAKERNARQRQIDRLILRRDTELLGNLLADPEAIGVLATRILEGLIRINSPEAWTAIGEALVEGSGFAVEELITRLQGIGSPTAINTLGRALGNRDIFVRGAAIRALTVIPDARVIAHLLRASRDPEKSLAQLSKRSLLRRIHRNCTILAELRGVTAQGVLDLMDEESVTPLLSQSYPDDLRALAARRLGEFGSIDGSEKLAKLAQSAQTTLQEACWVALETSHALPEEILLPLIQSECPATAARAVPLFVRHMGTRGAEVIRSLVCSQHAAIRQAVFAGLPQTLEADAIPLLIQGLEDPCEDCVSAALSALCAEPESTHELMGVVQRHSGTVKRDALTALAARGASSNELTPHYIEFLSHGAVCTDLSQRHYLDSLAKVAAALGKAGDGRALISLGELAHSVIRRIRRAAVDGIMAFDARARADTLHGLIDTHDPDVLKNVAFGLSECDDPRSTVPLIRAYMECRGLVRKRAGDQLERKDGLMDVGFLIQCLQEPFASVRQWGASRLQDLHDARSIEPLLLASRDDDVEVQLAVFEALGPFGSEHEGVRERLLEAISFGDVSVRQAACEALGNARCVEAVPDLIRALHNFFLRPRATIALQRIGSRKGYLAIKRLERREKLFSKKPQGARNT